MNHGVMMCMIRTTTTTSSLVGLNIVTTSYTVAI